MNGNAQIRNRGLLATIGWIFIGWSLLIGQIFFMIVALIVAVSYLDSTWQIWPLYAGYALVIILLSQISPYVLRRTPSLEQATPGGLRTAHILIEGVLLIVALFHAFTL